MISAAHASLMAAYNQWMNSRIYAVCARLTDAQRKLDRGAFFGSLHHTLDHLLYADLAFLSRFTGDPPEVPALGVVLHDDFGALTRARAALDRRLIDWAAGLDAGWLREPLTYRSLVDGQARSLPRWVLVTHLFNHQTHHRGQITTLLSQLGLDVGSTDIPFMDGLDTTPTHAPGRR